MAQPSHEVPQKQQCSTCVPEHVQYKNRLQEYTQKSFLSLPVYHTLNEGTQHEAKFRSKVLVGGKEYVSKNTFSNRKASEQDVARLALECIFQTTKDDIYPFIHEDIHICKSILNEFAAKKKLELPSYTTNLSNELPQIFISEVTFNGVKLKEKGRTKKEAERLAARSAILMVLDSESRCAISKIIWSKSRLCGASNKMNNTNIIPIGAMPITPAIAGEAGVPANKRKDVEGSSENATVANPPITGASETGSLDAQVVRPFHEFKKPKVESSLQEMAPPIVFVPPVLSTSLPSSSSVKETNHENGEEKAVLEGVKVEMQLPIDVTPPGQVPPAQ